MVVHILAERKPDRRGSMKTVLIIEDDPIILHIYKDQVEKAGFAVETAVNGEDGLRAVQQVDPDVILLDLMLPKVDGVEFLKRIRGQKEFEQRPIFVFTMFILVIWPKTQPKRARPRYSTNR